MSAKLRLFSYMKPYWRHILGVFISVIIVTVIYLAYPLIFGNVVIDKILNSKAGYHQVYWLLCEVFILVLAKSIFSYLMNFLMAFVGNRVVVDLRNETYQYLQKMSISYFESQHSGEIISRLNNDISIIQISLSTRLIEFISQFLLLIGAITGAFLVNWRLALLTIAVCPFILLVVTNIGSRVRNISRQVQEKAADLLAVLQETLSGIKVIKAFTMEKQQIERFRKENDASFFATMKAAQTMTMLTPIVEILFFIGIGIIIWYSSREVIQARLTGGQFISFFLYIGLASTPLYTLTQSYNSIQQATTSAERLFKILDMEPDIKDTPNAVVLPKLRGELEFRDVTFAYRDGFPVLSHINLEVQPGEVVALVGPSGAGKTSLVNLVTRFYDPIEGQILIDGYDIKNVQIESFRRQISLVPQESVLFGVTIKENISYGKPEATDEEIIAAAKAANAHDFIKGLPQEYDTLVGERGALLSGGQKQRVAIARALLRDPRILILDEATSSLDNESERLVQEALENLMAQRTTLVIAHRLSTIKYAHKIIVLAEGKIVEQGTHDSLLEKNGLYKRLYDAGIELKNG